ncbi:calcineurin-like phosphoesterase C-terminal domain-containing protein [candidate division KSB1 bacterium]
MKKTVTALTCLMLLCVSSLSAQNAKGTVYHDRNANGVRDAGEQGIPSVGVSNGHDVVMTDNQGRYELTVNDDTIIFVIKPAGYRVPVDDNNLRKFYYIHKPSGSPELEYAGSGPTGPLPESVDFPLLPGNDSDDFSIIVFGDTQVYSIIEVDYLGRDLVAELIGVQGYEFGITLGDNVGDDLDLHGPVSNMIGRIGIPWHYVMGNHDENYDATTDVYADERFEATFGPATYSFNYGSVHFIVFDDILYPDPRDGEGYWGGLRDDQLTFVENDLKHVPKDHLIVCAMHIPMLSGNSFNGDVYERLITLLKPFPNTFSMSAHTHTQRHHFHEDSGWEHHHYVVGTACGDWWSGILDEHGIPDTMMRDGTPNGYARITFKGSEYTIDYKVARSPDSYRMNIYAPLTAPRNQSFSGELYVNFFNGSERAKVEFRIDDGSWREMRKTVEHDPIYVRSLQTWDSRPGILPGERPSNPVDCTHLWKAQMPIRLSSGAHVIEVRVTDMFGRTFRDFITYRVVG